MTALLTCVLLLAAPQPAEVNVALAKWGLASARASSQYGPTYGPENAIDGRWQSRETDKWNSASNAVPHWLILDLGRVQPVSRVVIRHEGVFGEGEKYNTSDFQLQVGDSGDGPWTDLVAPIRGNHDDVTTHVFATRRLRFLRLWITAGEQQGNEFARIFEVEVYARAADLDAPLVALSPQARWRTVGGRTEQAVTVESAGPAVDIAAEAAGASARGACGEALTLWLPVPAQEQAMPVRVSAAGRKLLDAPVTLRPPGNLPADLPPWFHDGRVVLLSSSHQDIGWMDTIDRCVAQRDRQVISPALELLDRNPRFCFCLEDGLELMEYLGRHPEQRDHIAALTRAGRLEWGATYNMPYESFLSGEELVRQVYYGKRYVRSALPGADSRAAWSPDVPGRALQFAQVLAKCGVPYLIFSRQEAGLYRWQSPDGSEILAWTPGHYGDQWDRLAGSPEAAMKAIAADARRAEPAYTSQGRPPVLGYLMSVDSSGPRCLNGLLDAWPRVDAGDGAAASGASLSYATGAGFLDQAAPQRDKLPLLRGERPNVWLYIHGPTHHHMADAKREAARLLPDAEAFSAIADIVTGGKSYPAAALDQAWRDELYVDHGIGGYYGELNDAVFQAKCEAARDTGRQALDTALTTLAAQVKPNADRGRPLVVFNDLAWARTAPVSVATDLPGASVTDAAGKSVPAEIVEGSLRFAADVPSLGYATYYVQPANAVQASAAAGVEGLETPFYRITLAGGGLKGLFDKDLGRELLRTGKFLGGELFTMQSVGNGAGEFAEPQQPTMEEYDHLGRYAPPWRLVWDGPVSSVAECDLPQSAQQFRHCSVHLRLTAWKTVKRLDLDVDLRGWDGTPYREFRLAFPVNADAPQVSYEVPLGVVQVGRDEIAGAAGERYKQPCRDVHPREVQNWFDASGPDGGLMISSSVAVFDWKDPTPNPAGYAVLQPLLLASRRSCHGLGNWYLQPGDHHFAFSLHGHAGDWRGAWRRGVEANHPLFARWATAGAGALPERLAFLELPGDDLLLTALKRPEEGQGLILRAVEMAGRDASGPIRLWRPLQTAGHVTPIEDPISAATVTDGALQAALGHHAVETWRLAAVR
jgi:alpha-mannosidase